MVIIVFRRSPISLQRVRKESDEEVNTGGEGDERGGEKREKEGRRMEEMRGDETEPKKTNQKEPRKICTCKHHTSTESNHEEHTGFTLVWLKVQRKSRQSRVRYKVRRGQKERRIKRSLKKTRRVKESKAPPNRTVIGSGGQFLLFDGRICRKIKKRLNFYLLSFFYFYFFNNNVCWASHPTGLVLEVCDRFSAEGTRPAPQLVWWLRVYESRSFPEALFNNSRARRWYVIWNF